MDYKIIEKPEFTVVGKALRVSTKNGENLTSIPAFWMEVTQDGSFAKLEAAASRGTVVVNATLGICLDFSDNMDEFTYMVAAEGVARDLPEDFTERTIPASTWAVFASTGAMPAAIQEVWGRIWSEFLPTEPYIHAAAPDLEVYPPGDSMAPDYGFEVWVPVVRK